MSVADSPRAVSEASRVSAAIAAVLDALPLATVVVDAEGRVAAWNPEANALFAVPPADAVGRQLADLVPALVPLPGQPAARGWTREVSLAGPEGTVRHLQVTAAPLVVEGAPPGLVLLACQDRTEAVESRRRLAAVEEAVRVEERHAEFLAMLAHELRNPLMPILAASHALRGEGAGRPGIEQARRVIERQVKHLARLVDDLLDVSRIRHGKIELRLEPVDLAEAVREAREAVEQLARAGRQELAVSFPAEGLVVWGDRARLVQVLANLLHNAVKFTGPGGRVAVSGTREGQEAVVRVTDTGIGIEPELLPRLFDLFTQGDRSLARARGGLGVGLALVRQIVALHGGRVAAASAGLGRGSEFTIWLPLAPAAPPRRREAPAAPAPRPARVLVVEDNADAREMLRMALEQDGHAVTVAGDGPRGVATGCQIGPDVVVIDIGLPGLDGYEVARALRRALGSEPLLVALSGYSGPEAERRAQEAGFDLQLTKPVDPEVLMRLVTARPRRPRGGGG